MRTIILLTTVFLSITTTASIAQIAGCTDPQANNYNAAAIINNGSCTYASSTVTPTMVKELGTTLKEISGMVYFKGKLLVLNDAGGGNKLYMIDTINGNIQQTITVAGATNKDWEDISQDSNYIYVGDCGNNANGNRTDLCFYKIDKAAFTEDAEFAIPATSVQKINYSYPDQTNFAGTGNNKTRFDCEAFVVHRGRIHLFTKNWIGNYSVHYALPTNAGTYVAERLDSLNTDGNTVTGASLGGDDFIALTAYNTTPLIPTCSMYFIYGFDHTDYFFNTGNRRLLQLPNVLTTGQIEAISFVNATRAFVSNEYASNSFATINASLKKFTATSLILDHYKQNPRYPGEIGMVRYNTTVNKYEVFTGTYWEYLGE